MRVKEQIGSNYYNATVESHQFQTHEKRHHVNEMMKG